MASIYIACSSSTSYHALRCCTVGRRRDEQRSRPEDGAHWGERRVAKGHRWLEKVRVVVFVLLAMSTGLSRCKKVCKRVTHGILQCFLPLRITAEIPEIRSHLFPKILSFVSINPFFLSKSSVFIRTYFTISVTSYKNWQGIKKVVKI